MFSNQTAELSLGMPIPAMDALRADRGSSRFLVGTSSVRESEDNHLYFLKYYQDANQLATTATLQHPTGPCLKIVTSPTDKSALLTIGEKTSNCSGGCTLWKMPSEITEQGNDDADLDFDRDEDDANHHNSGNAISMEEQFRLQSMETPASVVDAAWRGGWDEEPSSHGDVMTLHADGTLTQWDVAFGANTATRSDTQLSSSEKQKIQWNTPPRLAWDPHHADITAVSTGTMVQVVDWRTDPSSSSSILSCPHHRFGVTDLDYNPNKPYMLVTSGKDGLIKFWDLRKSTTNTNDVNASFDSTTPVPKKLKKLHPLL
ncbi:MAG: hypothetical protein SGARI_005306, partial [Bacillariaceae sp.]